MLYSPSLFYYYGQHRLFSCWLFFLNAPEFEAFFFTDFFSFVEFIPKDFVVFSSEGDEKELQL